MLPFKKVTRIGIDIFTRKTVDDYQFYFHFFGDNALYKDSRMHALFDSGGFLRKTRKIGRKLDKNSVVLDGTYNSGHGLADGKERGIFAPCTEQFLV